MPNFANLCISCDKNIFEFQYRWFLYCLFLLFLSPFIPYNHVYKKELFIFMRVIKLRFNAIKINTTLKSNCTIIVERTGHEFLLFISYLFY